MKQSIYMLFIMFQIMVCNPICGQTENTDSLLKIAIQWEVYADSCMKIGDVYSALTAYSKSEKIRKNAPMTKYLYLEYAFLLDRLAYCYSETNNYIEAVRSGTEAMDIYRKILGTEHLDYAFSLNILAYYNSLFGNYTEAIKLGTEAMEIHKKVLGVENPDYLLSLSILASYYSDLGNYAEAIKLGIEAVEIRKKNLGAEHPDYVISLSNLVYDYAHVGNYAEAIRLGTEVMVIRKKILGVEHPDYAISLSNLAYYNSLLGNYTEAIRLGTDVVEIRKKVLGVEHPDYLLSLSILANYNYSLGNYPEAIRLGTEAMEIRRKVLGAEHPHYATSLNNLAGYNSSLGNYPEAIRLGTEAIRILKTVYGLNHPIYATSLNNLANYNSSIGNYLESIRLGTEAMEIRKKALGDNHPDYAVSLSNLANFNAYLGNYKEGLLLEKEAMDIRKKVLGINHPDYATSLVNLAVFHDKLGMITEAVNYLNLAFDNFSNTIVSNFSALSSQRRQYYWEIYKDLFLNVLPEYCFRTSDSGIISLLYDKSALQAKGILLNTEIEMKKLIEDSHDHQLIEDYQNYLMNYEIFNKQSILPIVERFIDTDSLYQVLQEQEDNLISKSKVYGDYMHNLSITWKDVQQSLGDKDLAVEFLNFPVGEDRVIMYVALTIRKNSELPKMTILFEEKQLKQIPDTLYYQCKEMANLVWKPLLSELQGIENIYFSPSGSLHKIGIEYLPEMEKYNFYRLTSTRELVTKKKKLSEDSAVLYGGLDYYAKIDTTGNDKSQSLLDNKYVEHANVRGMKLRGGKEYLPHTKEEVEQIATELHKANWTCQLDTLDKGREESFKSLSGGKINTLHISTHGFYYTPEEANRMGYDFLRLDNQRASAEDKALTRTGLIMSGANHILEGEELPDNVEDGILTAKEIADVDLRGLDLVVLSACQTGLGDISQGEGVFGLQRGFKKAGAKTILMSLWEVDDKATQILMTQFYKNLLAGQSKHQSLLSAQKYLREVENGKYNDPKYWASFILLDGLSGG